MHLARITHRTYYSFSSPEAYQMHLEHQRIEFQWTCYFLIIYVLWALLTLPIIAGWLNAQFNRQTHVSRGDRGMMILGGLILSMVPFAGILVAWLLTGFAEKGWKSPFSGPPADSPRP